MSCLIESIFPQNYRFSVSVQISRKSTSGWRIIYLAVVWKGFKFQFSEKKVCLGKKKSYFWHTIFLTDAVFSRLLFEPYSWFFSFFKHSYFYEKYQQYEKDNHDTQHVIIFISLVTWWYLISYRRSNCVFHRETPSPYGHFLFFTVTEKLKKWKNFLFAKIREIENNK